MRAPLRLGVTVRKRITDRDAQHDINEVNARPPQSLNAQEATSSAPIFAAASLRSSCHVCVYVGRVLRLLRSVRPRSWGQSARESQRSSASGTERQ